MQNPEPGPIEPFSLLSTLRYSPSLLHSPQNSLVSPCPARGSPFYMLQLHRDRLQAGALYFGWEDAAEAVRDGEALERFLVGEVERWRGVQVDGGREGDLRIRVLLSQTGTLTATFTPTPSVPLPQLFPQTLSPPASPSPLKIHISLHPTQQTPHTLHKTTLRTAYTTARTQANLPPFPTPTNPSDVLLYTPAVPALVTETSLCTVYLPHPSAEGVWGTPRGGQSGVTRRWAVERLGVVEGDFEVGCVKGSMGVWVSNGVWGWRWGRIVGGREEGEGEGEGA